MSVLVSNNATTELLTAVTANDSMLTVVTNTGALFPSPVVDKDWFYATIQDASGNMEIVKCTARESDTFTVVRGVNGKSFAFTSGAVIELRPCAELFNDKVDVDTFEDFKESYTTRDNTVTNLFDSSTEYCDGLRSDTEEIANQIKTVCQSIITKHDALVEEAAGGSTT